jgi:hypothetical protein
MQWISVQERYPKDKQKVLTIDSDGVIDIYYYDINYPWFFYKPAFNGVLRVGHVTHWMPLPEPPKK